MKLQLFCCFWFDGFFLSEILEKTPLPCYFTDSSGKLTCFSEHFHFSNYPERRIQWQTDWN
ncbi:MAG TPA: hypothetical protein DE060_10185 [Lentisphaeria bacterium]|nr:hypothetical protein [Lentisphaeria bacterium]HCG49555.1 hypothetical protein [Lentisphaeria bacterium]